jgi:tRNA G10  N-methylase Trm11
MYKYGFILGRVFTLSLAELFVVLAKLKTPIKILEASWEVLIIETDQQLDFEKLQRTLGGVIKIIKIVDFVKKREQDSVNFTLENYFKPSKLKKDYLKNASGKTQFGVSIYLLDRDLKAFGEPKRLGMFIKRSLQDAGASIRLVLPEFNALSLASVAVTHNQLLQKGAEITVLAGHEKIYVGKTLVVQDFEDYGRRDYQRPVRDEVQGMIPPKVAQIMINLANVVDGQTILDPMAGIGTLVQEGVLLGYRMIGTDKNKHAIAGSEKNLEWFRNRYKIAKGRFHVEITDVVQVSKVIDNLVRVGALQYIAAVVTEGTLGPIYSQLPTQNEMKENFKTLLDLYKKAFEQFLQLLPPKGRIVLCLPAYKRNASEYIMFPNLDPLASLGYNQIAILPPEVAKKMPFLKLTDRQTAIYDRKDQIVAREIVVFEKN